MGNDARAEFKKIWDGFSYHFMVLSEFMKDHLNDPFFKTEFGEAAKIDALMMMTKHIKVMVGLELEDTMNEVKENNKTDMMKDLLRSMIEKDEGG